MVNHPEEKDDSDGDEEELKDRMHTSSFTSNLVNRGNVLKSQSMFSRVSQMDGVTITVGSCEELITAVTFDKDHIVLDNIKVGHIASNGMLLPSPVSDYH